MTDFPTPSVWYANRIYSPSAIMTGSGSLDHFSGDVFVSGSGITVTLEDPTQDDSGLKIVQGRYVRIFNIGSTKVTIAISGSGTTYTVKPGTTFVLACHHDTWVPDYKASKDVVYDNSDSTLSATDVKAALDELDDKKASDYLHTQDVAASVWTVNHNLGKLNCSVTIKDSSHRKVEGQVDYVTENQLTITFTASFTGTVYIV